jgi:hypothetical protein
MRRVAVPGRSGCAPCSRNRTPQWLARRRSWQDYPRGVETQERARYRRGAVISPGVVLAQKAPRRLLGLKPAQRLALEVMRRGDSAELTRADYQAITGASRSQAAYDLADLVSGGILVRRGSGPATTYELARPPHAARRTWTSERIRSELASFCAGRRSWPSADEFKRAGRGALYVAASRYGGIAFWAAELGLQRAADRPVEPPTVPRRALPVRTLAAAAVLVIGGVGGAGMTFAVAQLADNERIASVGGGSARQGDAPTPALAANTPVLRDRSEREGPSTTERREPQRTVATLRAVRGDSWLSVRVGSAAGRRVFEGVLTRGELVRLQGKVFWLRVGASENVDAAIGSGRRRPLPARASVLLLDPDEIRVLRKVAPPSPAARAPDTEIAAAQPARPKRAGRAVASYAPSPRPVPLPAPEPQADPNPLPAPGA